MHNSISNAGSSDCTAASQRPAVSGVIAVCAISLCVLAGSVVGCSGGGNSVVKNPSQMRTVTDNLGRSVKIPVDVNRVVSLAPANAETMFAIGAGDKLVGATTYANYPEAAKAVERVGGFAAKSISMEKVMSLRPDVVLTEGDMHSGLIKQLEGLGVPALALDPKTLQDVQMNALLLGNVTGNNEQAKELVDSLSAKIAAVSDAAAGSEQGQRPRVFYFAWDKPLMTAGPTSFIGRMITMAGGENIFAELDEPFPKVSEETVVRRDPQLILVPARENPEAQLDEIRNRSGWTGVSAIKNAKIVMVDEDLISRPGPRIVDGLTAIAAAIQNMSGKSEDLPRLDADSQPSSDTPPENLPAAGDGE